MTLTRRSFLAASAATVVAAPSMSFAARRDVKVVEEAQGKKPKLYRDIREALADKSIDAVTIATPNHWHSLAAIWACQAGKDVYVEKPLCHNIFEGQQLVAAAKKYGKIVH